MLIDMFSERGYHAVVDKHIQEVPERVDLATGEIKSRTKAVYRIQITSRPRRSGAGEYMSNSRAMLREIARRAMLERGFEPDTRRPRRRRSQQLSEHSFPATGRRDLRTSSVVLDRQRGFARSRSALRRRGPRRATRRFSWPSPTSMRWSRAIRRSIATRTRTPRPSTRPRRSFRCCPSGCPPI